LDKSQASGKHEKALLDADNSHDIARIMQRVDRYAGQNVAVA
jgi:hypothetical protein